MLKCKNNLEQLVNQVHMYFVNATLNILIVTGAIFLFKKKGEDLFKYNLKKPLLEECLMQGNNPSWSVVCQKQR